MKEFKEFSKFDYNDITQFRIIPMTSEDKNDTIDSFKRNFFFKKLVDQEGKYFFKKNKIKTEQGSLIFFKYDAHLIAIAKYLGIEEYGKSNEEDCKGHLVLDLDSVAVFDQINQEEIYDIGIRKLKNGEKAEFGGKNANSALKLKITEDNYNRLSILLMKKNIEFYNSNIT